MNVYNNGMNETSLDDLALYLSNSNNDVKVVANMLNYAPYYKDTWGSGDTAPRILQLGTISR
jgi:hypothetical protein